MADPADTNDDSRPDDLPESELDSGFRRATARVREFPQTPGVYLMKDSAGVVIYVGKAKNLRSRAGSYFLSAALEEPRTGHWVREICDADFIATVARYVSSDTLGWDSWRRSRCWPAHAVRLDEVIASVTDMTVLASIFFPKRRSSARWLKISRACPAFIAGAWP